VAGATGEVLGAESVSPMAYAAGFMAGYLYQSFGEGGQIDACLT